MEKASRGCHHKNHSPHHKSQPTLAHKDWEDATCSVCMDCPHNSVLLLCSSHDKGCRPYMCGTSFRHSNCLEQYLKASSKLSSASNGGPTDLVCPLCRGHVKGWTVVEPAREHLNSKRRSCVQEGCSFVGTFKELRKHVRAKHPCGRPNEVDPARDQRWRRLEREREREDVMGSIRSSNPGAVFFGDYVIEGGDYSDGVGRNPASVFWFLQGFGLAGRARQDRGPGSSVGVGEDGDDRNRMSLAGRLSRQGRVVLSRSGRRRRHREAGRARR